MSIIQSRRRADLAAVAVSGIAAAWTAYTPTVVSGAGTLTTVSGSGKYVRVGKIVCFWLTITITTNGTGSSTISSTLPVQTAGGGSQFVFAGRESTITGKMLQGACGGGGSTVTILNYDNTYPGADGATLAMSGVYQAV